MPNGSSLWLAAFLAASAFTMGGCTSYGYDCSGIEPAYDLCLGGDSCSSGTSCTPANASARGGGGSIYPFCTTTCSADSDCPRASGSAPVVCYVPDSTTPGICYQRCDAGDGNCLGGFTCTTEGAHKVCVPSEAVDYYGLCDNTDYSYY